MGGKEGRLRKKKGRKWGDGTIVEPRDELSLFLLRNAGSPYSVRREYGVLWTEYSKNTRADTVVFGAKGRDTRLKR
jgi:hypothetical protein